jgi:HK97 family phage major capsid protein
MNVDGMIIEHGADPGDVIGYAGNGEPIYLPAGGVRNNYDNWIPEEFGSDVLMRVSQVSAVETHASRVPMNSNTKSVPRSAGIGVDFTAKGAAYGEDVSVNDQVVLTAQKFTKAIRVAEEDLDDSLANILATKQKEWATSYAKAIDNASVATTAAPSGTVPFASVYYALTQTNANTGYTGNANLLQTTAATAATYDQFNTVLGKVEVSDYFDESRMLWIVHPSFRAALRGLKDSQGDPIFRDTTNPDIQTNGTLFGIPLRWSLGAKTSAVATSNPNGNPLAVVANMDYMLLGIRSGPESAFAPADSGVGFLTDEALLKMRARRAFAVGNENAFSVLEQR